MGLAIRSDASVCVSAYPVRALTLESVHLCPVHTADTDNTRLSCLVLSVSAVRTDLETNLGCWRQKNSKLNTFSFFQFCPVSK